MVKSLKYLLQFTWVNLACILGFAVLVTLGAHATGAPNGAYNLFSSYFGGYPFLVLIMAFIFAISFCTVNLSTALSFGARRRDYFWALQANMLVYAGGLWALQIAMASIPTVLRWSEVEDWTVLMTLGTDSSWIYPLVLMSTLCLGALCGLGFGRSKVLGVILFVFAFVAFMAAMVVLLLSADKVSGVWGDLRLVLFLFTLAVFAVSEFFIWRTVRRAVVR